MSTAFDARMAAIADLAHNMSEGQLTELAVGVEAWSKSRTDEDGQPIGGIIVEAHAGARSVDDEGEIVEVPRTFVVFDRYGRPGHQWHRLSEPDIDRPTAVQAHSLAPVVRRLAADLGASKSRKPLTQHEINLGRYIGALVRVVRAPTVSEPVESEEF